MRDKDKTKEQLIAELNALREKIAVLNGSQSTLKNEQNNLELYQAHLEEITEMRTAELVKALKQAEKANDLKDTFLANISHEFHTPIHQINSYSQLGVRKLTNYIKGNEKGSEEKILQYFKNIHTANGSLFAFITSLFNLMQLENGEIRFIFKKYNLLNVVHSSKQNSFAGINEKKLDFVLVDPLVDTFVEIDVQWIGIVLNALFSNAIKFSPEGGKISVTFQENQVCLFENRYDGLQINISDQGVGIPDDELEYIFEKFTQSSRTKDGSGGRGIGLAVCHKIISDHHGDIRASNNEAGGATFSLTLPYSQLDTDFETIVLDGFESS